MTNQTAMGAEVHWRKMVIQVILFFFLCFVQSIWLSELEADFWGGFRLQNR